VLSCTLLLLLPLAQQRHGRASPFSASADLNLRRCSPPPPTAASVLLSALFLFLALAAFLIPPRYSLRASAAMSAPAA
jgi:hypothetical protein